MSELIRINLLDWREANREERRRNFIGALMLTAIACAGIIGAVTLLYYGSRIDAQQMRNDYLDQQITIAEKKMVKLKKVKAERANLIRRMRIIEDLQQSRAYIVHFFDQLVATVPKGTYLTSLNQSGNTTTLEGIAESNARVSDYMVNLDDSQFLDDPKLIVIKSSGDPDNRYADFTLQVTNEQPADTSQTTNTQPRLAEVSQ